MAACINWVNSLRSYPPPSAGYQDKVNSHPKDRFKRSKRSTGRLSGSSRVRVYPFPNQLERKDQTRVCQSPNQLEPMTALERLINVHDPADELPSAVVGADLGPGLGSDSDSDSDSGLCGGNGCGLLGGAFSKVVPNDSSLPTGPAAGGSAEAGCGLLDRASSQVVATPPLWTAN